MQVRRSTSTLPNSRAEGEISNKFTRDAMVRLHYKTLRSGPSWIVNGETRFHFSTAFSHAEDLENILRTYSHVKSGMSLFVDGGPDWNPRSNIVFIAMGC